MKIFFISGVKLGLDSLEFLIAKKEHICGVLTYLESHSNRSGYVDFSPICKKNSIPIFKADDLTDASLLTQIKELSPDLILVIGYSFIIPDSILKIPKYKVIGHHPTLLPKHKGNAPIPWSLITGLTKSGVTFFYLESKIDSGLIVAQKEFDISFDDDASTLYQKMTNATLDLLPSLLSQLKNNSISPMNPDPNRSSKWPKRKPEDGIIDWNTSTINLYNWIRAQTHPYPGAFTFFGDKKLFIWKSKPSKLPSTFDKLPNGSIISISSSLVVKTGDGSIDLLQLSFENDDELDSLKFVKKYSLKVGDIFG